MLMSRNLLGTVNCTEFKCLECGWWWPAEVYSAGYELSTAILKNNDEEEDSMQHMWACNYCILDMLHMKKLFLHLN